MRNMLKKNTTKLFLMAVLAAALLLPGTAMADHDVTIYAGEFDMALPGLPDGATTVPMWGYSDTSGGGYSSPGPAIVMPAAETTLNVTLVNQMQEDTSFMIPGLVADGMVPVTEQDDAGRTVIISFDRTVASGDSLTFTFQNVRPGAYLYHSAAHPAKQVQMGLYGALTTTDGYASPAGGGAITYNDEVTLVLSEIDPEFHEAVDSGAYGTPLYPSANNYKPTHFLINGKTFDQRLDNGDHITLADTPALIRFVNAGNESHSMMLPDRYMNITAQNAYPVVYEKKQLAVYVPPQNTADVIVDLNNPDKLVVFDRMLNLTNADQAGPGGMMINLYYNTPQPVPANANDLNGDGVVDGLDVLVLTGSTEFGAMDCSPEHPCRYDLNGDGKVNLADVRILRPTP